MIKQQTINFDETCEMVETPSHVQSASSGAGLTEAKSVSGDADLLNFRPCGYGLEASFVGEIRKIGSDKIRKLQFKKSGRARVNAYYEGKMYYPPVSMLVARAWCPDYYDGCKAVWIDGDVGNNRADNLRIVSPKEFQHWKTVKSKQEKTDGYGVFLPTGIDGIECTIDGVFRREGVIQHVQKKTCNGAKKSAVVRYRDKDGLMRYYTASHLVARAWHRTLWYDGACVIYKDGNKHNIHADNIEVVDEARYDKWVGARSLRNKTELTVEEEVQRLEYIKKECELGIELLKTCDYTNYNKYVERVLVPNLVSFCKRREIGLSVTRWLVPTVIGRLYELLDTNRGVYSATLYCEKQVQKYQMYGELPKIRLPKKIENEYKKIDYSCLLEKYRKSTSSRSLTPRRN